MDEHEEKIEDGVLPGPSEEEKKVEEAALPGIPAPETEAVPPTEAEIAAAIEEGNGAPKRDLDKERDDRVIPVAQGVLEAIAGQNVAVDVNDKSEFTNLIITILKSALAADLNLTTDNPYIFQLVLGVFGAFNQVVMTSKMSDMPGARYSLIAHEMMGLLAEAKVPMGMGVKTEDQVAAIRTIQPQLEEIFAREMLTSLEVRHILEGLMNALKVTEQSYSDSVQQGVERMETKILRIDSMTDLTMKQLDAALTANIEDLLKPEPAVE
jgi:hypothetical protein